MSCVRCCSLHIITYIVCVRVLSPRSCRYVRECSPCVFEWLVSERRCCFGGNRVGLGPGASSRREVSSGAPLFDRFRIVSGVWFDGWPGWYGHLCASPHRAPPSVESRSPAVALFLSPLHVSSNDLQWKPWWVASVATVFIRRF